MLAIDLSKIKSLIKCKDIVDQQAKGVYFSVWQICISEDLEKSPKSNVKPKLEMQNIKKSC